MSTMRVEFFGIPRQRAGMANTELEAKTLGQMFSNLVNQFPALADVIDKDRLRPSFVANLNGDCFVTDPGTRLTSDDCVLILSADAGG
jgi:molybdopterin converting factor small subunit